MIRGIVFFFVLVLAGVTALTESLESDRVTAFLSAHSNPRWSPVVLYGVGQGRYLIQDLSGAALVFTQIAENYPGSTWAERSMFYHAQVVEDQAAISREALIKTYETYLDRYPQGRYSDIARRRIASYRSGAR